MNFFSSLFVQAILVTLVIYLLRPHFQKTVERIIKNVVVLPDDFDFSGKILPSLVRVILLNWYTYLMLFSLWGLLFLSPIGRDTIDTFLTTINYNKTSYIERLLSYLWLFLCTFLLSLSTWAIPFFLFSLERIENTKSNFERFYLSTKLLAIVAMLPFLIICNAFIQVGLEDISIGILTINIVSFGIFLLLVRLFTVIKRRAARSRLQNGIEKAEKKIRNTYLKILIYVIGWVLLIALMVSAFSFGAKIQPFIVGVFIFISSVVVFRLLFFSDETNSGVTLAPHIEAVIEGSDTVSPVNTEPKHSANIKLMVERMLSPQNARYSFFFYMPLFISALLISVFYFLAPSLDATNTLFILMIIFSFFIFYLDFWRNCIRNKSQKRKSRILRSIGFVATALFLVLPFINRVKQFTVPFAEVQKDIKFKPSLEDALNERIKKINAIDSLGHVYIICAMGGGSRAGYITAAVLNKLDTVYKGLWDRTLCYSTVSGGTVGAFNFIKGRENHIISNDSNFLDIIYQRNYNSSGAFGLLLGDAAETLLGSAVSNVRDWVTKSKPTNGFHDRNYRIRKEYDYILEQALKGEKFSGFGGYWKRTFYPWTRKDTVEPDMFQGYFIRKMGQIPVHLINTFEINSGRRTVITPFPTRSESFFPNAIKPLQDTSFDCGIARKDIRYREAVNLSELFPFVSAASHIGFKNKDQFVDGGYYENYGISTALDVVYYLKTSGKLINPDRIRVILIKNSKQEPELSSTQVQILAPLIGAMQAPFTGHANHLWEECRRVLGTNKTFAIEFDADKYKVPLTRALTPKHIVSMKKFINKIPDGCLRFFIGTHK